MKSGRARKKNKEEKPEPDKASLEGGSVEQGHEQCERGIHERYTAQNAREKRQHFPPKRELGLRRR